jgi:RHS repeat-associated protein
MALILKYYKLLYTSSILILTTFQLKGQSDVLTLSQPLTSNTQVSAFEQITLLPTFSTAGFTFAAEITQEISYSRDIITVYTLPQLISGENYIHTITPQKEFTSAGIATLDDGIPGNEITVTASDIMDDVTYFDGLGRSVQNININRSPKGYDVVQHIKYDDFGRQDKDYMLFTLANNNGKYIGSGITGTGGLLDNFYSGNNNLPQDEGYPCSQKIFDNSPLNRIIQHGAPGIPWQPDDPFVRPGESRDGHTIKFEYGSNSSTDHVRLWEIYYGLSYCFSDKEYSPGALSKTKTWDEEDNLTIEYKDKSGNVVLKQTFNEGLTLCTYYVYDAFGLLRYVLPPKLVNSIPPSFYGSDDLITDVAGFSELGYYYEYDKKQRMIVKKLPGADEIFMVYDIRDRLVATQDGELRNKQQWLFTKYDPLNRPIITGLININKSRPVLQSEVDGYSGSNLYELPTGDIVMTDPLYGYSNNSFPDILFYNREILTLNYYDKYDFNNDGIVDWGAIHDFDPAVIPEVAGTRTTSVIGRLTVSRIKMLHPDGLSIKWLTTVFHYDKFGRILQSRSRNYLDGFDITSSKYDFTNKLLKSVHQHGISFNSYNEFIERTEYVYDHAGRVLEVTHAGEDILNSISLPKRIISAMKYNELGQLKEKYQNVTGTGAQQHASQKIDYCYNIRGWLTSINNPDQLGVDLFAMNLYYNETDQVSGLNTGVYHNGNISSVRWIDNHFNEQRGYGYIYDELSRIKKADYGSAINWTSLANFDVGGNSATGTIEYDQNGNIISLYRHAADGTWRERLRYDYNGNKLRAITSNASSPVGIATMYTYNDNGNMISDGFKGIGSIVYNYLNLPEELYGNGFEHHYRYYANGTKIRDAYKETSAVLTTTNYVSNFVYKDGSLAYILLDEGRIVKQAGSYLYEYYIKDHLGNTRVVYNENNQVAALQVNEYYPFGLLANTYQVSTDNDYLYNGKELQKGTDWYEYGARMYDPFLGRFHMQDRFAEKHYPLSPYQYGNNNPIFNIDVNGDWFSGVIEWLGRIEDYFKSQITAKQNQIKKKEVNRVNAERAGNDKKAGRLENRIQRQERQLATLNTNYSHVQGEINEMASSSQEYHINPSFGNEGAVGFDWSSGAVTINFNSGSIDALANFGHELKHGSQFEEGKISLVPNSIVGGALYDLQDEAEAYQRMQMFGKYSGETINPNWVTNHGKQGGVYQGIKGRTNQITTLTQDAVITYGRQIGIQINKAGQSSAIPKDVIIHWQYYYSK